MTFKTEKIITGILNKTSAKTNKSYTVIVYLDENGTTFTSMAGEGLKIPDGIKQLSNVEVEFEVTIYNGNVQGLKTLSLELLDVA